MPLLAGGFDCIAQVGAMPDAVLAGSERSIDRQTGGETKARVFLEKAAGPDAAADTRTFN